MPLSILQQDRERIIRALSPLAELISDTGAQVLDPKIKLYGTISLDQLTVGQCIEARKVIALLRSR